jgi:glyoxylase-like metal-dependent hydrolase (beta-lactamase superfamily II)
VRPIPLPSSRTECVLLSDGRGRLPLETVFEDVDPDELAAALGAEPNSPEAPYNCLLMRAPDALVLVDTGLGRFEHPFGGSGGQLWQELERASVAPADVDVVIVTHGHLDHIGGATRDGRPAFPRARYVIAREEWSHWTSPTELAEMSELSETAAREQLPPLEAAGVVDQISGAVEVAAGVQIVPAPGHTVAHVAVEVGESRGLLYAVDALLHPLQVARPEWGRGMDRDADAAVATRRSLLERAAERGHVLAASHWDEPVSGRAVWRM